MIQFNKKYLALALFVFIIEVVIALYVNDAIIRPYGGDFLVVVLLYCFFRGITNLSPLKVAIFVLLFSYAIEWSQYLGLIYKLGLGDNQLAKLIIGTSFAWEDILMYTLGTITAYLVDVLLSRKN